MKRHFVVFSVVAGLFVGTLSFSFTEAQEAQSKSIVDMFVSLVLTDTGTDSEQLADIERGWQPGFTPMVLETLYLNRNRAANLELLGILLRKTGQDFSFNIHAWNQWLWNQPEQRHAEYAAFKSALYGLIDTKFTAYFSADGRTDIRLDEVTWGGVRQDGIPPLRSPKMISADDADYLEDNNVVFGIDINGDARAYPKRILAWHEMFIDEVGGLRVAGVYCTLCGAMVLYRTEHQGVHHALGTSGFLYRSNKLMYDRDTQSLWNTLWGVPVIGPLAGTGMVLERLSVVTTTWAEWRKRHPQSKVLSLDTGHSRDYREGAAYRDYFATDDLMFTVPAVDTRLKNKDSVLALRFAESPAEPIAIAAAFLNEHRVFHQQAGSLAFVVLTDQSGANRVYQSAGVTFTTWDQNDLVTDDQGNQWRLTEQALTGPDGAVLNRLPAHRAFWFGWYAAYSKTRLIY